MLINQPVALHCSGLWKTISKATRHISDSNSIIMNNIYSVYF